MRHSLAMHNASFCLVVILSTPLWGQVTGRETLTPLDPRFHETLTASLDSKLPAYEPVGTLSGEIRSASADIMEAAMKCWIEDFTKIYPNVHFTLESVDRPWTFFQLLIIPALTAQLVDTVALPRELLPAEEDSYKQKFGRPPFCVQVAGGSYRTPDRSPAMMFFVNVANPIEKLTLAQLDAILSNTRRRGHKEDIHTWGQLGATGDWANAPIRIYGGSTFGTKNPSGIAHFIQLRVMQGGAFKDGIHRILGAPGRLYYPKVMQAVAADRYSLGYSLLIEEASTKVVALAEKEGGPYYRGTFEEVANGQYPLSRATYICMDRVAGEPVNPVIAEFLKFVVSRQGQQDVVKEGVLLPLRANVASRELAKLK